jgi:hypothetical protein
MEVSASRPCLFIPGTHCLGGWVGPGVDLDVTEKIIAPAGNWTPAVQPVARRYTNWPITDLLKQVVTKITVVLSKVYHRFTYVNSDNYHSKRVQSGMNSSVLGMDSRCEELHGIFTYR